MTFRTNALKVQAFAGALFGVQVGTTTMAQVNADITSNGGLANTLNGYYASSFGNVANATVAASVAANLGLTGDALASGTAYITAQLNGAAAGARGAVISTILDQFAGLTADATFGAAATAYNAKVTAAVAYTGAANVAIGSTVSQGTAFTLTADLQNLAGTSGNDTFGATHLTLQPFDTVNGGDGTDTLVVALGASYSGGATISGIETISMTATADALSFEASGISGVTTIATNGNSTNDISVNNIAANAALSVSNSSGTGAAGAGSATFTFTDAALVGTTDTVNLSVANLVDTDAATNGVVGYVVNINTATGNASGAETIAISSTVASALQIASNDTSVTAVTVNATAATTLDIGSNLTTTARSIDASASTAAVAISGLGSATHTIRGGAGSDSFNFGGNLSAADVVHGGEGTDTLASTHANMVAIAAGATFTTTPTSIETIHITNDFAATTGTVSANLFGGAVTNLRIADQSASDIAAFVSSGLLASTAAGGNNIRFDGDLGASGGSYTVGITNATVPGTVNTATLDMRGVATTATSTVVINGVENLTIDTTNATGTKLFNITNAQLSALTVLGAQTVDIDGAALGGAVTSVNAAGLTGTAALNIQLNGSAALGATITTAAGADVIVASSLADVISSGSGNDTITGGAGADIINVGSGADIFIVTTSTTTGTAHTGTFALGSGTLNQVSTADFDVITGMAAGDTIRLSGYTTTGADATNSGLDTDVVSGNTVATTGGITLAQNSVHLIRGIYDSAANTFVGSSTGVDTLFVFDASYTSNDTDFAAIVLVGYTATTATIAGTTGDVLFV